MYLYSLFVKKTGGMDGSYRLSCTHCRRQQKLLKRMAPSFFSLTCMTERLQCGLQIISWCNSEDWKFRSIYQVSKTELTTGHVRTRRNINIRQQAKQHYYRSAYNWCEIYGPVFVARINYYQSSFWLNTLIDGLWSSIRPSVSDRKTQAQGTPLRLMSNQTDIGFVA